MSKRYILAIDQSTQGTKGILFDQQGVFVARTDRSHRQFVDEKGWVEHDPEEILTNTLAVARDVVQKAGIGKEEIAALGISNQRETVMAWDRSTGKPLYRAIVWQCARAKEICEGMQDQKDLVKSRTGLNLSPYFSAAKLTWIMQNVPEAGRQADKGCLCCGTMDSWLVYQLTTNHAFKTDYSNASRTQLLNIHTLQWDEDLCKLYGVPKNSLPEVCMSDSVFGNTTFCGWLEHPIPICGVLGDSHGALLGQECRKPGMIKATYGTGSSVMMQTGKRLVESKDLVTSLAWGLGGHVEYVLEGNLNYTGAVVSWLKNEAGLLANDAESEALARAANPNDRAYFVPAFTGLGAPYWDSEATGLLTGVTRTTGRAEIVKACVECIAYQITDLIRLMKQDSDLPVTELRVDGGPTANQYLMQFQSDISGVALSVPNLQELSGMGAAYAAGFSVGMYDPATAYAHVQRKSYESRMEHPRRETLYRGWQQAIRQALAHS
ncbi:MAG: glycerol kinase GlpK [Oscillospiraceae bacterium]|nr:glycerol kinase GlpK [Oscillospiraceae bacterium]